MLRRSFFSRLGLAAAVFGISGDRSSGEPVASASQWQPARHEQDDWLDELPGKHRVLFDTWTAPKFGDAIVFAGNYFRTNRDAYDLTVRDLAFVLCVRHQTAPFAFNDAMWAKYGKAFSKRMEWVDPNTHEPPSANVYNRQLTSLASEGLQLAVCRLTTRAYTQIIAEQTHTSADEVYKELIGNTIGRARFVPAGIVAATRAQERGYAIISIG